MNKQFLVIVILSVALVGFLFSRPKVVIKDEAKANRDKPNNSQQQTEAKGQEKPAMHKVELSAAQQKTVTDLTAQLAKASDVKQKNTLNRQLADVFATAEAVDSSAYYYEQIALLEPNTNNWLAAGDAYFQAFSLALRPENTARMAEKTRACYKKVLALNPRELHAKTNLAMTYVSSESPMQAIMMLREVLNDDPNYIPAMMNMGVLSLQSGQYDKAVTRFKQVLAITPENQNAQLGLAYSLIETGGKKEAKEILVGLMKTKLDPVLQQEVKNTLDNLK